MKNVTITVDEQVARWARIWAAEHDTSVSRLVGQLLCEKMEFEQGFRKAMKRDLARQPLRLKAAGRYPTREELHDRKGLR
jgi:hypothetical protein